RSFPLVAIRAGPARHPPTSGATMQRPPAARWPVLLYLVAVLVACRDQIVAPEPVAPEPSAPPGELRPLGIVEISFSNLSAAEGPTAAVVTRGLMQTAADLEPPQNVDASGDGTIQLERVSSGSFTLGTPGEDGQRYFMATFRVRNAQS